MLPNLQMPQSLFAPDELLASVVKESFVIKDPSQEKIAEDPNIPLADTPWAGWRSRNTLSVGELLLEYFE